MPDDKTLPVFSHRGCVSRLWYDEKDNNRIHGTVCLAEDPDAVIADLWYAGDTVDEVKMYFMQVVDRHISLEHYKKLQLIWKADNDYLSIASVYNIIPKEFKRRVREHEFDKSLIDKVIGGFYEVPLYYVTKAWDFILNGSLCGFDFSIGPWHDNTPDEWSDFIAWEHPERFRCQAIANNNEMKQIWQSFFDIDIETLDVDFSVFDRHLPPKVSSDEEYDFFQEIPDGVEEYILGPINNPSFDFVFHDTVSDLMEYAAYLKKHREEEDEEEDLDW